VVGEPAAVIHADSSRSSKRVQTAEPDSPPQRELFLDTIVSSLYGTNHESLSVTRARTTHDRLADELVGRQMDRLSQGQRSALMSRIGPRDTAPEMRVRRLLYGLGYRYRLHVRSLPGTPDLVFPSKHRVLFVHGCYWHRHMGCRRAFLPKSRVEFWDRKFAATRARDARVQHQLEADGWRVMVVWECETTTMEELSGRLVEFLGPPQGKRQRGTAHV
jgi:DNA mismatch endonuclease, patch repair protein